MPFELLIDDEAKRRRGARSASAQHLPQAANPRGDATFRAFQIEL